MIPILGIEPDHFYAEVVLNLAQYMPVAVAADETDGNPNATKSACAANAMQVGLSISGVGLRRPKIWQILKTQRP